MKQWQIEKCDKRRYNYATAHWENATAENATVGKCNNDRLRNATIKQCDNVRMQQWKNATEKDATIETVNRKTLMQTQGCKGTTTINNTA